VARMQGGAMPVAWSGVKEQLESLWD